MTDRDEPRTVFEPERTVFDPAPARPVAIKEGDILNHMFLVKRFLARGGMGEVFEGSNLATDERVAIKVMLPALAADPNVITLFRREAQTLTRLHHEAVVQYRVLAQEPQIGVFYIATEFIDGTSLSEQLGKLRPSAAELGALLRRLASGLAAAHALGAIHRDVSPDNVLLGGGELGRAKLIDFGIVKDLDPGTATVIGDGFAGKLGYVAPEQLGDHGRKLGPWTDVYSLGLVILALARGRDLGLGGSLVDAVDKRRAGLDLSAVPAPLRSVVDRMVRHDPNERLQSMDAVIAALADAEVPGGARAPWPRPRLAAVVAASALVLVVLLGWLLADRSEEPEKKGVSVAAVAGDPVSLARAAVEAALPSISCTWLDIVLVKPGAAGPAITLTGVAGAPAAAQAEIDRSLATQDLPASGIDFTEVAPIKGAGCAALDAYRQIRNPGRNRLSAPQRRFEMRTQAAGQSYAGTVAANAVIGIAPGDPSLDFALVGLEPSGRTKLLIANRAAFAEAITTSENGVPITDLGGDRYRLQVDLDHAGWSGLLLVTGRGPFDEAVIAPPLGARDSRWRERLVDLAAERGWQADMVWFRSVDDVRD